MFDDTHLDFIKTHVNNRTVPTNSTIDIQMLNAPITRTEMSESVLRAKLGKAAGFENIPAEVLRNGVGSELLYKIISHCFENGSIPKEWNNGIINPIPKADSKNPNDPLSYRGITLLSVPYKVYADVLNQRLSRWLETNDVLVEEQNGFRKKRSCLEHIYSLFNVVNTRKLKRSSTYVCFIDIKKAFDAINRECLWFKLMQLGLHGNILNAITSLYDDVQCALKVNDLISPWFPVKNGLKQGCKISPTLFSIYINDLAKEINELQIGVNIDETCLSILLYADDIALIAPDEVSLQLMLNTVNDWCTRWRLTLNQGKTKIVHFRGPSVSRSEFKFVCGDKDIEYSTSYRYLGLWFNEFMNMKQTVTELVKSASRALSALYTKSTSAGGFTYDVYKQLYESLVEPVLFYCAGVWGVSDYIEVQRVQNKALRLFLGGGKCSSNVARSGDLGWHSCQVNRKVEVFRLWLKLERSPDNRLTKSIHTWALRNNRSWESRVLKIARETGLTDLIQNNRLPIKTIFKSIRDQLCELDSVKWGENLLKQDKLRTYRLYKNSFNCETYCQTPIARNHRSILFKFRSGSLQLHVETGRYNRPKLALNERTCNICKNGEVEDERHFLMSCTAYSDLRFYMFKAAGDIDDAFNTINCTEQFRFLMTEPKIQPLLASTLFYMFNRRKALLVHV